MLVITVMKFIGDYNVQVQMSDWKKFKEENADSSHNTWVLFKDGMSKSDNSHLGGACESMLGINYLKGGQRFSIPFDTGGALVTGGNESIPVEETNLKDKEEELNELNRKYENGEIDYIEYKRKLDELFGEKF
jgi:hypothetical protein